MKQTPYHTERKRKTKMNDERHEYMIEREWTWGNTLLVLAMVLWMALVVTVAIITSDHTGGPGTPAPVESKTEK